MSSENARRFFNFVAAMRSHQRKYFETRSSKELCISKKYEEIVDDIIHRTKIKIEEQEQQKSN